MNKTEYVEKVAEKTGLSKKATDEALKAFIEVLSDELADGGSLSLIGFGTFSVAERAARTAKNPRTGELLNLPKTNVPRFKPSGALKSKCN